MLPASRGELNDLLEFGPDNGICSSCQRCTLKSCRLPTKPDGAVYTDIVKKRKRPPPRAGSSVIVQDGAHHHGPNIGRNSGPYPRGRSAMAYVSRLESLFPCISIKIAELATTSLSVRFSVDPTLDPISSFTVVRNLADSLRQCMEADRAVPCRIPAIRIQASLEKLIRAGNALSRVDCPKKQGVIFIDGKRVAARLRSGEVELLDTIPCGPTIMAIKGMRFDAADCSISIETTNVPEKPDLTILPRILRINTDGESLAEAIIAIPPRYRMDIVTSEALALSLLKEKSYDLVVADVGREGSACVERLRSRDEPMATPFIFLRPSDGSIQDARPSDDGVFDVLAWPDDASRLTKEISCIIEMKSRIELQVLSRLQKALSDAPIHDLRAQGLSDREIEVAASLCRGMSKKEIADDLGIAVATTKRHIENIYAKLQLRNRFQLYTNYVDCIDRCIDSYRMMRVPPTRDGLSTLRRLGGPTDADPPDD